MNGEEQPEADSAAQTKSQGEGALQSSTSSKVTWTLGSPGFKSQKWTSILPTALLRRGVPKGQIAYRREAGRRPNLAWCSPSTRRGGGSSHERNRGNSTYAMIYGAYFHWRSYCCIWAFHQKRDTKIPNITSNAQRRACVDPFNPHNLF